MIKALIIVFSFVSVLALSSQVAFAWNPFSTACSTGGSTSAVCTEPNSPNPISGPHGLILRIVDLIAVIAGAAAVVVVIIGGFRYITSAGIPANIEGARNTILYAVIGIIVIVVARTLIVFVVTHV